MSDIPNLKLLQRMFRNACSFSDAARLCEVESTHQQLPPDSYSIPGIVNSAFSCEVFLKSLLVYHEATLEDVKEIKHHLFELWKEYKCKDLSTATLLEKQICYLYKSEDTALFNEKLKEISDAFYDWRYVYEDKKRLSADRNFMRYLRDVLRENCCVIYYSQTWNEFVANGFKWYGK